MLTTEQYKELEDKAIQHYVTQHNKLLERINKVNLSTASPAQLANVEHLYSQAQVYAFSIAGYYRDKQKQNEALAEIAQADAFEAARKAVNSTDAQYLSRKAKGEKLQIAARCEGNYIRWSGIAKAYENSVNSIKDLIKSWSVGGNGHAAGA